MEWFNSLEPLLKGFWIIAFVASLIFVIQTILTFVGMDSHVNVDGDIGHGDMGGPFQLFTFRNLINFLLGFSWTGVCLYHSIGSKTLLNLLALLIGCLFVLLFFLMIKQILKLAKDNTFQMSDIVGLTANVYLRIPAEKSGCGKIQVSAKGSIHEIEAMTEGEEIPTGRKVKVIQLINNQTVLVYKL